MAGALFCRKLGVNLKRLFLQQCRTGYIVLLPEVNPEVTDQNVLFKTGLPDIKSLTQEKCVVTLGKYLLDFEHSVREVENELLANETSENEEDKKKTVFSTVVEPLETLAAPLETTWGLVKTLYLADSRIMPAESYISLHERARRARSLKYNSHHIYKAFKKCDDTKLTEEEQRVVSKFLTEGKLNGLELQGDNKLIYADISKNLAEERSKFRKRVEASKREFKHVIIDPYITKGFPEEMLHTMAGDEDRAVTGPWKVTLSSDVFPKFLEYCPDRDLRWNVWLASRQVASAFTYNTELHNSSPLERIRMYRRDLSKLLGYESFAHMSMETKMVGTVEKVDTFLSFLLEKAKPAQLRELSELQRFAEQGGFEHQLQHWDIPYWQRKQKEALYNWNEETLKEYFPLDKVMTGLMGLCSDLFSLRFVLAPEVETWYPDVKYYQIFDTDSTKPIAGLYFDPYSRPTKLKTGLGSGHVVGIRPTARSYGPLHPLAAIVCNFPPPASEERPCLLSFDSVDTLFQKFGNALQHVLSSVNYSEVSGMSNIEWDAVPVVSNIMSLWLNNADTLKSISRHYKTGETLPETVKVEAARRHLAGYRLSNELYLARLDLRLHDAKKDFWLSIVREEWSRHFALALDKGDSHPCSFTQSISDDLSAAYYGRLWAAMLAADAYSSFANQQADIKSIGTRFRDTFLAFGGSCHPSEVFRRFQGRDPEPDAFIKSLAIEEAPQSSS